MTASVTVGGREYRVEEFNGRKAILAARIVARITKLVPGLLESDAEFQRRYAQANALRLTKAMTLVDGWRERLADITDEDWEALGGEIVIPQPAPFELRFGVMFAEALDSAEEEVLKLLALAVSANEELAQARRDGRVKEFLVDQAEQLLDAASLGELADLALLVVDRVRAEFAGDESGLGKLRAMLLARTTTSDSEPSTSDTQESSETTSPPSSDSSQSTQSSPTAPGGQETTTSGQSSATKPTSFTSSPAPTDGVTSDASTSRHGASSAVSATA